MFTRSLSLGFSSPAEDPVSSRTAYVAALRCFIPKSATPSPNIDPTVFKDVLNTQEAEKL